MFIYVNILSLTALYMTLEKFQTGLYLNAWLSPYIAEVIEDGAKASLELELQLKTI